MNEKRRYRAEYAKRSTGACKDRDCSGIIEEGELRVATVVKVGILLENPIIQQIVNVFVFSIISVIQLRR